MREVWLTMSMSLDGFVAGPKGEIEWIFNGDQDAIAWKLETLRNASLHIMGSRTFRDMASHWPTATGPFAEPMNQIPKAVFSRSGRAVVEATGEGASQKQIQPGGESWGEAHVASGNLAEDIARLKAVDGKPIVAHGGAAFVRSLIARDLVDRYVLMVYPVVLGAGLPLFTDVTSPRRLELLGSTAFPKGTMGQIYRRAQH